MFTPLSFAAKLLEDELVTTAEAKGFNLSAKLMKDRTRSIYVRIVGKEGMRITVSCTHPGDFDQIGEPPIKIDAIEITGRGRPKKGDYLMVFSAKSGQVLNRLELNKRYNLSSC